MLAGRIKFERFEMPAPNRSPEKLKSQRRSAKAVILRDREVLLLHRPCGRWDLPGGQLKTGEAVSEGLLREVAEETGLRVRALDQLMSTRRRSAKSGHCLSMAFLCAPDAPLEMDAVRLSEEHDGFAFVDLKNAGKLNLPPHQKKALHAARKFL